MEAARQPEAHTVFEQFVADEVRWNRFQTNDIDRLLAINKPVLLVRGERDLGIPGAAAERAAGRLPHARLVKATGAGHRIQRDRPDLVVPEMLGFLKRLI